MNKITELVDKINNANSILLTIINGTVSCCSNITGQMSGVNENVFIIQSELTTFECDMNNIETGEFVDDDEYVFRHNGTAYLISIV